MTNGTKASLNNTTLVVSKCYRGGLFIKNSVNGLAVAAAY